MTKTKLGSLGSLGGVLPRLFLARGGSRPKAAQNIQSFSSEKNSYVQNVKEFRLQSPRAPKIVRDAIIRMPDLFGTPDPTVRTARRMGACAASAHDGLFTLFHDSAAHIGSTTLGPPVTRIAPDWKVSCHSFATWQVELLNFLELLCTLGVLGVGQSG